MARKSLMGERRGSCHGFRKKPGFLETVIIPFLDGREIGLFIDEHGVPHARVLVGDHCEIHLLESEAFGNWLVQKGFQKSLILQRRHVKEAVFLLKALAAEKQQTLFNRSAWIDNKLYIDLADSRWRVVCVSKNGWHLENQPPGIFRRFRHQQALPEPDRKGRLEEVLQFLPELPSPEDQLLLLVWLTTSLVPNFPRPILIITGVQGSGKTSVARFFRGFVDPSQALLLGRDAREDWPLTFFTHAVPIFDNFDRLSNPEADFICQAVTGRSIVRRKLYTDTDQVIFSFNRTMIFTGLRLPTNRLDLLDRSLILELERITPEKRKAQQDLEARFETARPRLFGGLLNTLSCSIAGLPHVSSENLSRMADFHRFGRAVTRALGLQPPWFDEAYRLAEGRRQQGALDNTFALAFLLFAQAQKHWRGQPRQLFKSLQETAKAHQLKQPAHQWPQSEVSLGRQIQELKEMLVHFGVNIDRPRRTDQREIVINYNPGQTGNDEEQHPGSE